jgi:hypothetical protein
VNSKAGESSHLLNTRVKAPLKHGFASLGEFNLVEGESVSVTITTDGADGTVHADGLQIVPVE